MNVHYYLLFVSSKYEELTQWLSVILRAFCNNECPHSLYRYHETFCWICSPMVSSVLCLFYHISADALLTEYCSSTCTSNLNRGPSLNPRWIYDTPVHSDVEAKLRQLLVELGNAEKILGIQVHTRNFHVFAVWYPTNLLPFPKALYTTLLTNSGVANTTNAVGVQFLAAEKSNARSLVKISPWKRNVLVNPYLILNTQSERIN